jgi:hypothetical protein
MLFSVHIVNGHRAQGCVSMYKEAIVICSAKVHVFVDIKLCELVVVNYIVCASLYGRYTRYVLQCA